MSENAPNQDSSKEDLDKLSALEESMASFGMGGLDFEHGVILKDWSAQDFANIYVRFRAHLIKHAQSILGDPLQAEEVVQDAFLYLLTALPELDSELGVLKFLKWKTRMLSLDVIRTLQRRGPIEELREGYGEQGPDPADSISRADDAAVVSLALSKLDPRHRSVLLSSIDSIESTSDLARKFGVTENGYRQLLYRARKAFREALIGKVSAEGKTISELLSIAARKAASSRVPIVIIICTMALFGLSTIPYSQQLPIGTQFASDIAEEEVAVAAPLKMSPNKEAVTSKNGARSQSGTPVVGGNSFSTPQQSTDGHAGLVSSLDSPTKQLDTETSSTPQTTDSMQAANLRLDAIREDARAELAMRVPLDALSGGVTLQPSLETDENSRLISASLAQGFEVSLGLAGHHSDASLSYLVMSLSETTTGVNFVIIPTNLHAEIAAEGDEQIKIKVWATDFLAGDAAGQFENLAFDFQFGDRTYIELFFTLDSRGDSIVDASFRLLDSEDI